MTPGKKLILAASVVIVATAYMAYVGASASWKYYLTADECVADGARLVGQRMRVSGKVAPRSVQRDAEQRRATFTLRGTASELPVVCSQPLPDNLTEDMEVVVEGRLVEGQQLQADKVLTRCATKYESGGVPPRASIPAGRKP